MSQGNGCTCPGTRDEKIKNWVVVHYRCNYSAFSGYKRTTSDYSAVKCLKCLSRWRTKADYVLLLPKEGEEIREVIDNLIDQLESKKKFRELKDAIHSVIPKGSKVVFIGEPSDPGACEYCGNVTDLRPYGKDGALICFDCGMKPENKAITDEMFGKAMDEALGEPNIENQQN